jgi:hypothetical protein
MGAPAKGLFLFGCGEHMEPDRIAAEVIGAERVRRARIFRALLERDEPDADQVLFDMATLSERLKVLEAKNGVLHRAAFDPGEAQRQ